MPIVRLADGARLVLEARDPTTGAEVGGVTISEATLLAEDLGGDGAQETGPWALWLQPLTD